MARGATRLTRFSCAKVVLICHSLTKLFDKFRHQLPLAASSRFRVRQFASGLKKGGGVDGFWFDWIFARILLREAEALIEPVPGPSS